MATSPALAKQLKEHLQEQQEPFKLSTYLSERRNSLKKLSSNGEDHNCCGLRNCTSTSDLKETCSSSYRKKGVLHSLRPLMYKLIASNEKQEPSACNNNDNKAAQDKLLSETIDMLQHIAETNWFSTTTNVNSFGAAFDYGNGSLVAETSQVLNVQHAKQDKTDTDMHQNWNCKEGDKQLNPETVLLKIHNSHLINHSTASKIREEFNRFSVKTCVFFSFHETGTSITSTVSSQTNGEPLFSAFLLEPLVKSVIEKHIQVSVTEAMERVDSGKLKRLLFDCMKKTVINNVRNYKKHEHLHKFSSQEELRSIISRQLCSLGKQLVYATDAAHVINLDFSTLQEWGYFQKTKGQICRDMGDSIIDEIINEIIDLQ